MTSFKQLKELGKARHKQKEARERLLKELHKPRTPPAILPKPVNKRKPEKLADSPLSPTRVIQPKLCSWKLIRSGSAKMQYFVRADEKQNLQLQPWAHGLVNTLLEAANEGGVHICLIWPASLDSLSLLHALANVERNFARDLRGMRTLLYPGTFNARTLLQSVLANREQMSDFFRSLWVTKDNLHCVESHTRSTSFEAMLSALNDIRIYHPELANPSLGELVPFFMYEAESQAWVSVVSVPLERSLKKVDKLARRQNIREKVNAEWRDPRIAPDALMVLHHSAGKSVWKRALAATALKKDGHPEVLLLDATSSMEKNYHNAVMRIPDFLKYAVENNYESTGAVIVADDPKIFFVLRARLNEFKLSHKEKIWAAEAEDSILSTHALPIDWEPEQKSNANFNVSIVDRDASQVARAFQKLAQESESEEMPSHQAAMAACFYILRLSNMPAGYKDLTAQASETGGQDFSSQRNAWTSVRLGLQHALESGALNAKRVEADKAIADAEKLIDDWADATPMAAKLLAMVQKYVVESRKGLTIVLPNAKYILLAHRFLKRKLDKEWATAEARMDWHTLSSIGKVLTDEHRGRHFIFIGVNRNVLRLLVTHPDIPHGTTVLVAYKQADSTLTTLTGMKGIEEFKPYRGRMGLLALELERRLKETPNPLVIGKLGQITMTFRLDDNKQMEAAAEQHYYKFDLEGGAYSYASSWVYLYDPDEDPFFRRVMASTIQVGNFIFELSDELRSKLEAVLQIKNDSQGSVVYPERALLKLYHDDVKGRCDLLFKATKRSALAREIHAKMVKIDSNAVECSHDRVNYWLALRTEGDTKPHASRDTKYFKVFCRALEISDEQAVTHWNFIRNARRLNRYLGRELSARYAEILFQPESAVVYRKVPEAVIKQLRQDALRCVYRVERVFPPQINAPL